MPSNNIKYLGNHAERLRSLSELLEGEIYVVGRGTDAFKAFRMPNRDHIRGNYPESFLIKDISIYEAQLRECGKEIEDDRVQEGSEVHLDNFIDIPYTGVFRPTQGSKLMEVIVEKLGVSEQENSKP